MLSATPLPRSPRLGWLRLSLFLLSLGPHPPRHRRLHLEACRVPGAGAWLTANPSCVDSHISSPLFRVALQRRGITPLPVAVVGIGFCAITRSGMWSAPRSLSLEKPGLLLPPRPPDPGGPHLDADPSSASSPPPAANRRLADVWVPRGVSGFAEAWDFSVSSLLRPSHISSASPSETRKRAFQDTASLVAARGATFCPLVLEACGGGCGPRLSGASPMDISLRIAQRISCTLHRENARAVLRRSPDSVNGSSGLAGDLVPSSGW